MSQHPVNRLMRSALEILAPFAMAYWGWSQHDGTLRWILAIATPVLFSALWILVRSPHDPNDRGLLIVPGWVVLVQEFAFFAWTVVFLVAAQQPLLALIYALVAIAHYVISHDRVKTMLAAN
jgi:hypothetical protein